MHFKAVLYNTHCKYFTFNQVHFLILIKFFLFLSALYAHYKHYILNAHIFFKSTLRFKYLSTVLHCKVNIVLIIVLFSFINI